LNTPTVWVPKDSQHSFAAAAHFGTVKFMFPNWPNPLNLEAVQQDVVERLATFDPTQDFLLLAGPLLLSVLCVEHLLTQHGVVRLLLFHASREDYVLQEIRRIPKIPGRGGLLIRREGAL